MNLAVCLAGCLDVTPLKSLLQVVPSWYSHNYVVIYEKFSEPPGPDLFFIYSGNSENTPNVH